MNIENFYIIGFKFFLFGFMAWVLLGLGLMMYSSYNPKYKPHTVYCDENGNYSYTKNGNELFLAKDKQDAEQCIKFDIDFDEKWNSEQYQKERKEQQLLEKKQKQEFENRNWKTRE